ncbi:MAG: signal transduction protein [Leptolyngbya sp.]|nr:MAG: signal transduction protein [Leptolyngbya sp.]
MAGRSLTATPDGIQQINRALTKQGWSREDLAKECDCSRQPAVKFCSGQSVSNKLFVSFCKTLGLDWEEVTGLASASVPDEVTEPETDINILVQTIRAKVHEDIQGRCSTMRVLDMEQPIGLDDIFTNVNILEQISAHRRLDLDTLLQEFYLEDFDRFPLSQIRSEQIPAMEAVERYQKLIVFGRPGAGKTTFLKRLAIFCNQGVFQPEKVPIFITLKEFSEALRKPDIPIYIARQWKGCGLRNNKDLYEILEHGRALILLDGLDEIKEADYKRVLQNINDFTSRFHRCQFVITCRIAARDYIFQQFTEIEIADFSTVQISEFVIKWFRVKKDSEKAENFLQRLHNNKPIQELATNPLLLTLLCLAFGEAGDFPSNKAELYKEGLDVLLKKWDAKRNIERDQIYKKLSLKRKEDLLSQLAFKTFERGDYFFKQSAVEQSIIAYIRNLNRGSNSEEVLHLDSEAILNSIEAQHGLLVQRAKGVYSYSHLTFHEYFAARQFTRPTIQLSMMLERLSSKITVKRYREIFFLSVGMLPEADDLVKSMKQNIDQLIAGDHSLHSFLSWVHEKSQSIEGSYKISAVRAFYFSISVSRSRSLSKALSKALSRSLDKSLSRKLSHDLDLDSNLFHSLSLSRSRSRVIELHRFLARAIYDSSNVDSDLKINLEQMKAQLPDDFDSIQKWWNAERREWVSALQSTILRYRNIGHDWQFSEAQQEKIRQYYDANQLLVDCLNSDCYVTKATRQYIEDTLLLPISEIEKYPVPDAITNL